MGQYDEGLVKAVAKAMQSSKAWPVVFQADAAAELSRAAIAAVLEWQGKQDKPKLDHVEELCRRYKADPNSLSAAEMYTIMNFANRLR